MEEEETKQTKAPGAFPPGGAAPAEATTGAVPQATRLDELRRRVAERHPDREFADDEAYASQIYDDYDDMDRQLEDYRSTEGRIAAMFRGDHRNAQWFMDVADGKDPVLALIERYGTDIRDILDDPERQAEVAEANRRFAEAAAEEERLQGQREASLEESRRGALELQQRLGLSDEELEQAWALVTGIAYDCVLGKVSPQSLEMALSAINHDRDVEAASRQGELRGRNARIADQLREARTATGYDGVPTFETSGRAGTAYGAPDADPASSSIFDTARGA